MAQPVELPDRIVVGPVIDEGHSLASVSDKVAGVVLKRKITIGWVFGFLISFGVMQLLLGAASWLFIKGVGIWGINIPVGWGFAIVNFVWWIGIGHAGTLISAILLLLNQSWRNAINRFAEAMTLFAVMCAGMFPVLHTGRPWLAYWLFPYPNTMDLWPQFRSPLVWDVFAVSTYFTISLVFWYVGLIPDLATLRDGAVQRWKQTIYGVLALGWRSSARHWQRYEKASLLLAGLATPLVLSVHTVVSFDFAVSMLPGWHTTIFPPYFVAGAIYSGFGMVLTLMIPARTFYGLEDIITIRHLNNMAKVTLATGLIVGYGYITEAFFGYYSADIYEKFETLNRMGGPYAVFYWTLVLCNIIAPQALWFKRVRTSPLILWCSSIVVNIGMWLERFVIVVVSLHRDFLPSSWSMYWPTVWDWAVLIGTLGFFLTAIFIFVRILPMITIFELRMLLPGARVKEPVAQ
ncbi:MAG TPA: NrfD/PsrC family molybdoenzyme membrane anchor subunit [Bryobacteraceae bacterium]|jgi:molybdopterin-containing oxidoreductase family membrane subunit